jgi:hypothetical protein
LVEEPNVPRTIFLSWQDDTEPKTGHYFLKELLKEICEEIRSDATLEEAERDVAPDSDTQGVPGHTFIIPTILEKIDLATVFVADLTYTGRVADGAKATPNPNVLLEFGWAWKNKQRRIVSVMNTAYGHPKDDPLPFDLGFARWPTFFNLAAGASAKEREGEKKRLASVLKQILVELLKEALTDTQPDAVTPRSGHARFRAADEALGVTWDPSAPIALFRSTEVFLRAGAAIFLRAVPRKSPKQPLSATRLHEAALQTGRLSLRPIYYADIRTIRADDGIGICGLIDGDSRTPTIAFAFETGEVWAINTSLLEDTRGQNILPVDAIEKEMIECLIAWKEFFRRLALSPTYRWSAGVEGVRGRRFHTAKNELIQTYGGHQCLANEIRYEGDFDDEKQSPTQALAPFFDLLHRKCGYERR